MNIKDYFQLSLRSLTRRRLRSWLTMIGIFIGIAAVISLISLGQGMQDSIYEQFEQIGTNKLFVQPGSGVFSSAENISTDPLTQDDVEFLEGQAGVKEVAFYTMTSAKITYQDHVRYYTLLGVPTTQKKLDLTIDTMGAQVNVGRQLEKGDKTMAVLGFYHNQRGLYDGDNMQANSRFFINDKKFTVAGFLEPIGNSEDDKLVIVPIDSFRELTGLKQRVDYIVIEIADGEDPLIVAQQLNRALARFRGVTVGDEDYTLQTPEDLLASFQNILNIVQAVLIGIALISLFVGSVGIMNTMYTSVLERNKEIGIMKAIGAQNKDIFMLFLIESGILGFVGGLLGVLLGTGLASAVEAISTQALGKSFLQAHYSWELFVGALLFSFIVGALAGTLPAIQASKQKPADTLRDE